MAGRIAARLNTELNTVKVGRFADGEIKITNLENVRGCDCFIIQPTHAPADNLLELLLLADTLKRASAKSVTAVIPYFGYARQDRKHMGRTPISAKTVANLIEAAGIDRVLTMDLHTDQLQGFFNIPTDHIYARPVILEAMKTETPILLCAPDIGSIKNVRWYAEKLDRDYIWIDKRRQEANQSEVMSVNGSGTIEDANIIIIDDMIDTARTMSQAVKVLYERGANLVAVIATHGLFSGDAVVKLDKAQVSYTMVTNTLPQENTAYPGLTVLDTSDLFARAIKHIFKDESMTDLFNLPYSFSTNPI